MTDLAEFLLARIAEDEAVANAASRDQVDWATYLGNYLPSFGEMRVHAARWDPGRVLAECEAKRRIVELHCGEHYCPTGEGSEYYGYMQGWAEEAEHPQLCPTLRLLALPAAGHPDYQEEWAVCGGS